VHQPEIFRRTGFRWGVGLATLLSAVLAIMFGMIYWLGSEALFDSVNRSIIEQLELLAARPPALLPFMISSRMNRQPDVITLVGLYQQDGTLIVGDFGPLPPDLRYDGKVHPLVVTLTDGSPDRRRVAARQLPDGRRLVVARNVDDILELRGRLARVLVIAVAAAALLIIGGGTLMGYRAGHRLRRLNETAERIAAGHLTERLPVAPRGDDLDQFSTVINRLLDRLEELVEALMAVGADIAHDLRTPLTAVRARLERVRVRQPQESADAADIDRSIDGIDRALSTMKALLRIAEIEQVQRRAAFASFDLAQVVGETAETFMPLAEEKGIAMTVNSGSAAMIEGDRTLIVEALVNIVDNAVKFTHARGHIGIALIGAPGRPTVRVADDGPGIAAEERERVFRRFYRADGSRTTRGTGLGLTLVAAVAKLHGFAVRLADNQPGCVVEVDCFAGTGSNPDASASR
jgi:signal transduction histidine kinase